MKSINSRLKIRETQEGYDIQFIDNGVFTAKGKGYYIGNRLVFTFIRVDRAADGGIGIYVLDNGKLTGKHYNFDLSNRWSGVYERE